MKYYLGVDIGGTKSHALIVNELGEILGFSEAGPGSWEVIGWDAAEDVLQSITEDVIEQAGINQSDVTALGLGVAGYDWPEDRDPLEKMIHNIGFDIPFILDNDTRIGLVAGASQGWGVVISAGTSNNCRAYDEHGRMGRIAGMGPTAGEFGGAVELVSAALQRISNAWAKSGLETLLTEKFVNTLRAKDVFDLLSGIARDRYTIHAGMAPVIFEAARENDPVANELVCWTGAELAKSALAVIRQTDLQDKAFEVVLAGSLFKGGDLLIDSIKEVILHEAPYAKFVRLKAPPVVGGVLLAMMAVDAYQPDLRQKIIEGMLSYLAESKESNDWRFLPN
jgi:N-acetylglucosamine kinase-like BadF-type ATPase